MWFFVRRHESCFATEQNCPGALVFLETRYAAVVASRVIQSSNPMLWVKDSAPETTRCVLVKPLVWYQRLLQTEGYAIYASWTSAKAGDDFVCH
jgi:hypothetical protein